MTDKPKQIDECFIIMPIAETDGYIQGHFGHVYQNIIKPACVMANVQPMRADEVKASNLIHLDILKRLIEAPIAICDLSSRNPNVLFELGIRQAFDKPVVLIQEENTPRIFDIAPLRYTEYSREMKYHDVLKSQKELAGAIEATQRADADAGSVNSIVKLLALDSGAKIPDLKGTKDDFAFGVLQAEMQDIRRILQTLVKTSVRPGISKNGVKTIEAELNELIEAWKSLKLMEDSANRENFIRHFRRELKEYIPKVQSGHELAIINDLMEEVTRFTN